VEVSGLEKAIPEIEQKVESLEVKRLDSQRELLNLERRITSVKPTVDSINRILMDFRFQGFKLSESEKNWVLQNCAP
jgi:hypothetical protein